jgi:putative hydrolase of the HAD superfamily
MKYEIIFFDLDATLYPDSNGLWSAILERIDLYMHERMSFAQEDIPRLRYDFFINHGTTLRGLQIHHQIDPIDYLDFVHDLPLQEYLSPDPRLREMLLSIPGRCWVFTNADSPHANRVLNILTIHDCFEGMIDVLMMDPLCKPREEAYLFALKHVGASDPERCVLLDDSVRNLIPAKEIGLFTVLVGSNGTHPGVDRSVADIHDLPKTVPEIWD